MGQAIACVSCMSDEPSLAPETILATLREIAQGVRAPLWLFGGVAVDFIVGRWTRPHGDIDLNALSEDRDLIREDLGRLSYASADRGWMTRWTQPLTGRQVEIVFLERDRDGEAVVVVEALAPVGRPGRYATVPGYLDPSRWGELDGVRFRVSHPLGEWAARVHASRIVPGRAPHPKLEHDRRILEQFVPEAQRARVLRAPQDQPGVPDDASGHENRK